MLKMLQSQLLVKIKILSILACLIWQQADAQANVTFNCAKDVLGFPYKLENMAGIWYEAARMPPSEVPACVHVLVPNATLANDQLSLQLNYVNNVNNKWRPTVENLTFPWNSNTSKGIFDIQYGSGSTSVNFTFKLVATDPKQVAVICYYTNYAPSLTMLKIMTRQQQLDEKTIRTLQDLADLEGLGSQITWVQQEGRCNSAHKILPLSTFMFLCLHILLSKMFKIFY